MVFKKYVCLFILLLISTPALASPCSNFQFDKASHFAEIAGKKIIEKYGGGQDKRVNIHRCDYNSYSKKFKVVVGIRWSGAVFRENKYNVDGELTLVESGRSSSFSRTYASQNVKDLGFFSDMLELGVIIGQSSNAGGSNIIIRNECKKSIKIAVRYQPLSGPWKTISWWNISAGKGITLLSNNKHLKTKKSIIYYYAETTSGKLLRWGGTRNVVIGTKTYGMREFKDTSGNIDLKLTCP